MATAIAVCGAKGRMGRRVVALAHEDDAFRVAAALVRPGDPEIGSDAGAALGLGGPIDVALTDVLDETAGAQALVDFSVAEAAADRVAEAARLGVGSIVCTTGLDDAARKKIGAAAQKVPVVVAANTSLGITVLKRFAADLARALGEDYDVEIAEAHHRFKKDAPSGTALLLANAVAEALGRDPAKAIVHGRHGAAPRRPGEIGVHALRMGDVVGEHTISFAALGERIELGHRAHTRDTFARGALRAARWLVGRPPGLYGMEDVLGLR